MNTTPSENDLRSMLSEGQTLYTISRHFNTTIKEVHNLLIEYGITRKHKIPRPTKQDLESMYNDEHLTQEQIAKELGVGRSTVWQWLRNYNISTVGRMGANVPIPPKEVLEKMYLEDDMTQEQIAKEFDVDQATISTWLRNYNIQVIVSKIPSKEVLQRMYSYEGMTQYQISRKFNVTRITVGTWLRYYNISTVGHKGAPVPIPPKEVLEKMYLEDDMTQEQIAKEFGVGQSTVKIWLRNYNIQSRVPMPTKDDLLKYIDEGLNQHQIAEKYEVSDSTIFKWCEQYNIPGMVNSYRCMTDEHRNWRDAVFDRDNHTCQKCGLTNTYIQAHHIVPYCDHPEVAYELENGITLCKQCHESIKGREYDYIQQFAAITQPHLRDHEVIESMPWEAPLPPLSDKLFPDYQQEAIPCLG